MEGANACPSPRTELNVWRVVSEGMKNKGHQEKQFDAITKCVILSSLDDKIFNHVFACENAKELWKTIIENHKGTEDVINERYHVLIDKLNSFKQFDNENVEAMYSRLNVFVNEINSLGVKNIEDKELIRKMLHSLQRARIWFGDNHSLWERSLNNDTK